MTITEFFEHTLHAKLTNTVWSWGAINSSNRVFLRIWRDEIKRDTDREKVLVYRKNPNIQSHGHSERRRHLDAIGLGAQAFGIVCTARVTPNGGRKIVGFDNSRLLRLGALSEDEVGVCADIASHIPISELTRSPRS